MRPKCTTVCYSIVKLDERRRIEGLADKEFKMLILRKQQRKWKEIRGKNRKSLKVDFFGICMKNEQTNVKEEQKELRMFLSDFLKKRGLRKVKTDKHWSENCCDVDT